MEALSRIFAYLPEYHVAICKTHQHAVLKSQLLGHLDSKHKELTRTTRLQLISVAEAHTAWAEDETQVSFPPYEGEPIPYLPILRDAFMCTAARPTNEACGHINVRLKHIQEHCRENHGWENTRKRGRIGKGEVVEQQVMWIGGITCQKFQPTGRLGRLFTVKPSEGRQVPQGETTEEDRAIIRNLTQTIERCRDDEQDAQRQEQELVQADNNRFEFNQWLHRTGWAKHLAGLQRSWLLHTLRKPDDREPALRKVCWALDVVIWKAQQASKPDVVGWAAANYIMRREFGGSTNEKPVNAQQTAKTMEKYSSCWRQIVCYLWRTHELPTIRTFEREVAHQRPPYELTTPQREVLKQIGDLAGRDHDGSSDLDSDDELDEEQEAELEKLVLKLALRLLDHSLGDNEYGSALLSAMAALGVGTDHGWLSPLGYTAKQAAVVSVSRMLVLYQAKLKREEQITKLDAQGQPREKAHEHFELVKRMANRFMTLTQYDGKATPMDSILRLKAYGMHIRYNTAAEGVVDWVGDTVLYGNIQFTMAQLRSMIHGTIASARRQLLWDLMLLEVDDEGSAPGLPAIYWDKLIDNPAEDQPGWSFIKDPRNRDSTSVEDPTEWLVKRVVNEKPLRESFVDLPATREAMAAGLPVVWSEARVAVYGRDMKACRHHMAPLNHMLGGQPPRGSELPTLTFRNVPNGRGRGLGIHGGMVVCEYKYHKGIGVSRKEKVIHRYLPREVGELLVWYVWFVLPFWNKLQAVVYGQRDMPSAYIWEPELEKQWAMPSKRKRTHDGSSQPSTRRSTPGISSTASTGADEGKQPTGPDVELWNSNRLSHALAHASLAHMGVKLGISSWRHITKAIYRRYISDQTAVRTVERADKDEDASDDDAADLQHGHSSHVGGMIYGRTVNESMFSSMAKQAAFRRVSEEWHAFLQLPSTMEAPAEKGSYAEVARKEARREELRRWKLLRLVDVEVELRKVVGPKATFRGVQKPALQAIMRHESPVVAIMGTGGGKSVLFMLPALVSTGVTVVVVPLISLREDMKARCEQLGISCVAWSSQRPSEWAQVVLVTPESAVGVTFGQFMNRQRAMGRLDRIVVDECHVVLDSLGGWRSRMLRLRELVKVGTQLVYLTATMRPSEERQFLQLMGLPEKAACHWFRGATTRKNVRYQVQAYDREKEEEAVQQLVEQLKTSYPAGQIIVYCSSVAKTVSLAEALGCACFHRNVGSAQEKQAVLEQLTKGTQRVFTATNALGLGVDAPTIRAVVHVGTVRSMRQYAQESGRAGRDGAASEAIMMRAARQTRRGLQHTALPEDVEEDMVLFIAGEDCMRAVLDRAMDGRADRNGCEVGEEACQRCEGRIQEETDEEEVEQLVVFSQQQTRRQTLAREETERQTGEAMMVNRIVELMETWRVGCQWCRAWGDRLGDHELWTCEREGAEEVRVCVDTFEASKRWAPFSCCYGCGLPQSVCASFVFDTKDGSYRKQPEVACQYGGVLVATIMAVYARHTQRVGDAMEEEMRVDGWEARTAEERETGPGMEATTQWLSGKKRWGGIESTKMVWFLCRLAEEVV